MRVAYGVFGYGRGHASRAQCLLPQLSARHEVLVLAGGDAWEALSPAHPVVAIPSLGFVYRGTRLSAWGTLRKNLPQVRDALIGGEVARRVERALRSFRPDVVVSDAEPWTHQAASRLGIPRISLDHYGILAHCRPPIPPRDRLGLWTSNQVYRLLMGEPERVIVSSFYEAPSVRPGVLCVGPLLREDVLKARPLHGSHLLVYLNKGRHLFTPRIEETLQRSAIPAVVYGTGRDGRDGGITYRPFHHLRFVADLASCRAVISTAGNQLVGEAIHLRKPILVMAEDTIEQRVNALAVERLGIGARIARDAFDLGPLRRFLANEELHSNRMRLLRRDGTAETLAALEEFAFTDRRGVAPRTERAA